MFSLAQKLATARLFAASRTASFCTASSYIIPAERAPYNGLRITTKQLLADLVSHQRPFDEVLKASLAVWKSKGVRAVWLSVDIGRGDLISAASEQGFRFHHANDRAAMLVAWLPDDESSSVPLYATHTLGVGGIVLDGRGNVLTIRERNGAWFSSVVAS